MSDFARRLVRWQARHGRHDLPWQRTRDPYRVWLSEVMLQQTQVATVIPYYRRFLARFPNLKALARSTLDEVLTLWSGLGYYSRARNLHAAARAIVASHRGRFPRSRKALEALPGLGRSTAAAVAVFAFGEREAILDGNVKRVLARHFAVAGYPGEPRVEKRLWALAEAQLPAKNIEAYTQGLMDLGARVCTRKRPACAECPLRGTCKACARGNPEAFPQPRPRKPKPMRRTSMLLLLSNGEVLLEKRPPTGVWGGLWCLPEVEPGSMKSGKALPALRHEFTHFTLDITPVACVVESSTQRATEPGQLWLSFEEAVGAAVPAPVRKLLAGLASGRLLGQAAALEKALQD
ncbi:MAG TPA: A/G-specific adenine glycosylase [Burkholderiales bacterium]|nr:A/G-specific adenine glycosylase [Burkholderiales bacterium]